MMTGDDDESDFVMGDMTQRILQSLIDESIHLQFISYFLFLTKARFNPQSPAITLRGRKFPNGA